MSNYLEKYLKYKSKYQQLKNQIGGAKLGDHTYIIESGQYWGVIVGYNSSLNEYVVLQKSTRERFLKAENETIRWEVDNSQRPSIPSDSDIKVFIDKNRSRSDVVWFNPGEVTQPKISPRGAAAVSFRGMAAPVSPRGMAAPVSSFPFISMAAQISPRGMAAPVSSFPFRSMTAPVSPRGMTAPVSPRGMAAPVSSFSSRGMTAPVSSFSSRGMAAPVSSFSFRGMAAPVSSKLTLIELARKNTKFQEWIMKRTKSGLTSDLLFESDTFSDLLTDDAFIELQQSFDQDVETEWMKVGRQAGNWPITDVKSAEARIREISSIVNMTKYCSDCGNQVKLGTKCPITHGYHMKDN